MIEEHILITEEVLQFAKRMQHELSANAQKGDWRLVTTAQWDAEIDHHVAKLRAAIRLIDIQEYAADLANIAMGYAYAAQQEFSPQKEQQ